MSVCSCDISITAEPIRMCFDGLKHSLYLIPYKISKRFYSINVRLSVKVGKMQTFEGVMKIRIMILCYEDNSPDKYVDTKVITPLNTIKVRVDTHNKFYKSISYSSQVNHIYYLILRKFIEAVIIY